MLADLSLGLTAAIVVFAVAALAIAVAGTRLAGIADRLADRTGLGEAVVGAVFLGATTSISGSITSVSAAVDGLPDLAVGNGLGGIAAQTVFLVVADLAYRRVNLEHAAASVGNILQGGLLIALLAVPLLAMTGPEIALLGVHPASIVLPVGYLLGLRVIARAKRAPMWSATQTAETRQDRPDEPRGGRRTLVRLLLVFSLLVVVLAAAGLVLEKSGALISAQTGLGEMALGVLLTAVATSLPELVTTLAAVRRGALTLAVGGIIGGNAFDVLFLAASDIAYRDGSIYHAVDGRQVFFIGLAILMTAVLVMGLLHRERHGVGNIGFEGLTILALYLGGVGLLLAG